MLGINKLLAFLRRQVGLRTDAASATGSLHAKVAEELARIGAINPASGGTDTLFRYLRKLWEDSGRLSLQNARITHTSHSSTSLTTHIEITGSGYLTGITGFLMNYTAGQSGWVEVTIDGTVRLTDSARFVQGVANGDAFSLALPAFLRFSSSLRIRGKISSAGSQAMEIFSTYTLD